MVCYRESRLYRVLEIIVFAIIIVVASTQVESSSLENTYSFSSKQVVLEVCVDDEYYTDDRFNGCFQITIYLPEIISINESFVDVEYSVVPEAIGGFHECRVVFSSLKVYDLSTDLQVGTITLDNQVRVRGSGDVCIDTSCSTTGVSGYGLMELIESNVEEIASGANEVFLELYIRPSLTVWVISDDVSDEFIVNYSDVAYAGIYIVLSSSSSLLYTVTKTETIYNTLTSTETYTSIETETKTCTVTSKYTTTETVYKTVYGGIYTETRTYTETQYKTLWRTRVVTNPAEPSISTIVASIIIIVMGIALFITGIMRR